MLSVMSSRAAMDAVFRNRGSGDGGPEADTRGPKKRRRSRRKSQGELSSNGRRRALFSFNRDPTQLVTADAVEIWA